MVVFCLTFLWGKPALDAHQADEVNDYLVRLRQYRRYERDFPFDLYWRMQLLEGAAVEEVETALQIPAGRLGVDPEQPRQLVRMPPEVHPRLRDWTTTLAFHYGKLRGAKGRPPGRAPEPPGQRLWQASEVTRWVLVFGGTLTWLGAMLAAWREPARRRRRCAALMCLGVLMAVAGWGWGPTVAPSGTLHVAVAAALAAMAFAGLIALAWPVYDAASPRWLTKCPGCGYDLTGNVSGQCPECGRVTAAELRRQHDAEVALVASSVSQTQEDEPPMSADEETPDAEDAAASEAESVNPEVEEPSGPAEVEAAPAKD